MLRPVSEYFAQIKISLFPVKELQNVSLCFTGSAFIQGMISIVLQMPQILLYSQFSRLLREQGKDLF